MTSEIELKRVLYYVAITNFDFIFLKTEIKKSSIPEIIFISSKQ